MNVWTVLGMIDWSKGYLAEKGFANSRLESELLLSHALSTSRVGLYVEYDRVLKPEELSRLQGTPEETPHGRAGPVRDRDRRVHVLRVRGQPLPC